MPSQHSGEAGRALLSSLVGPEAQELRYSGALTTLWKWLALPPGLPTWVRREGTSPFLMHREVVRGHFMAPGRRTDPVALTQTLSPLYRLPAPGPLPLPPCGAALPLSVIKLSRPPSVWHPCLSSQSVQTWGGEGSIPIRRPNSWWGGQSES